MRKILIPVLFFASIVHAQTGADAGLSSFKKPGSFKRGKIETVNFSLPVASSSPADAHPQQFPDIYQAQQADFKKAVVHIDATNAALSIYQ